MIFFISNSGESLPIVYRLRKEGIDARIYIHNSAYRKGYNGILDKVSLKGIKGVCDKSEIIVFDITRPNEKTKKDLALLKIFKVSKNSPSVFGPIADKLKKTKKVIGCSKWSESIELDRLEGSKIALSIGVDIPETQSFTNLNDGIDFLERTSDRWVLKPHGNDDLDLTYVEKFPGELLLKIKNDLKRRVGKKRFTYILQKVIDGVEISTEGWFDGKRWAHFNHTLEDKRLMNFDLGPSIGSQNNTVWIKNNTNGLLVKELRSLTPILRNNYVGPIDINAIISEKEKKPFFLEFTPRFGWDALYCLLSLIKGNLKEFFFDNFRVSFHDGYSSSTRISIPPYPYLTPNLLNTYATDVPIVGSLDKMVNFWAEDIYLKDDNMLACAGSDGILGAMVCRGNSVGGSAGNVYREIDKLKIGSYLQYRTDLGKRAERAINKLNLWKIEIN